jgi:hypothetical protein
MVERIGDDLNRTVSEFPKVARRQRERLDRELQIVILGEAVLTCFREKRSHYTHDASVLRWCCSYLQPRFHSVHEFVVNPRRLAHAWRHRLAEDRQRTLFPGSLAWCRDTGVIRKSPEEIARRIEGGGVVGGEANGLRQ